MRIAWCPSHRGVMRISFFNPKPPHFSDPCPRCQGVLVEQIRNKYELVNPGAAGTDLDVPMAYEQEAIKPVEPFQGGMYTCPPGTHVYTINCSDERCNYIFPDELVTPAPTPLCNCCEFFKQSENNYFCSWCVDCPTEYCDIPRGNLKDHGRY